jgi:hypothetical protein
MTEPSKIKSEDGYTFYRLNDGRYADSLLEEKIDMSWNSFNDIVTIFENEKIKYSLHFDSS